MIKLLLAVILITFSPPSYELDVSATRLYQDYKKDKKQADKTYVDKRLFLHGIVREESANMTAVYLIAAGSGEITAVIDDSSISKVPLYTPGHRFDLVCIGAGLVFNMPIVIHCKPLN
jgi:hypothetical protein